MNANKLDDESYIKVSSSQGRISSQEEDTSYMEGQNSRYASSGEHNAFLTSWDLLTISQRDGYLILLADLSSDRSDYIRVLNGHLREEELQYVAEGVRLLEESGYLQFEDYKWVDPHLVLCIHKTL